MSQPVATPPTVERFLQTLTRSGLIDRKTVKGTLENAPAAARREAQACADHFIDKQLLTHFQATKLLQGTYQGLSLGSYRVLAPLGRGGMGAVYLARNTKPEKSPPLVALKVLPPKRAKEEERTLARFRREMEMCQRVSHPHITKTFAAGEIQGVYYIAMEYIRGQSLSQQVKENGPLPVARVARVFAEVAAGLAHAHEKGLIHRDLKPSNIMVTPNGHAKILDLGLAMTMNEDLPADKMIVGGQGYVVGTMDYIAPEQVHDPTRVDARADLYALGCSIFFALTGQPPFPGGTSVEKMKRHRTEYAEPLCDLDPTMPVEFARIVERLMEKSPARRFPSAAKLRDALLPWIEGDPEKPLDVDPMMSEAEALAALEKAQATAQPGLWWEDVPVISFEATAKYATSAEAPPRAAEPVEATEKKPWSSLLLVPLVIGGLILLVLLLELVRH